mgnify:CR=1 FL=1
MFPFTNTQMLEAVNQRKRVATPVMDALFTRRRQVAADSVQVDYIDADGAVMIALSRDAESLPASRRIIKTDTFTLRRFAERTAFTTSDLVKYRAPGVVSGGAALANLVADQTDHMRGNIDRTREHMCLGALTGTVTDGGGTTLATFPVASATNVDFGTGTNTMDALDDAAVSIEQAMGTAPNGVMALCGKTAYQAIRNSADVQDLLKGNPQAVALAQTGRIELVAGVTIQRVLGMGDNDVVITSRDAGFSYLSGPVSAEGGNIALTEYGVRSWPENDPDATVVRIEHVGLPIIDRPELIVRYTNA